MAKLPFVVEPRLKPILELIGTDDSGKIEVERKGYLTAGEKAFFQAGVAKEDVSVVMLGLVRKIAQAKKLDMQKAYEIITNLMTGSADDESAGIQEEYREDLGDLVGLMISTEQRRSFLQAYCMLLYRVDGSITPDEALLIHEDLLNGLAQLYKEEEAKSTEKLVAAMDLEASELTAVESVEKK
jgi:hypothetical protein